MNQACVVEILETLGTSDMSVERIQSVLQTAH